MLAAVGGKNGWGWHILPYSLDSDEPAPSIIYCYPPPYPPDTGQGPHSLFEGLHDGL